MVFSILRGFYQREQSHRRWRLHHILLENLIRSVQNPEVGEMITAAPFLSATSSKRSVPPAVVHMLPWSNPHSGWAHLGDLIKCAGDALDWPQLRSLERSAKRRRESFPRECENHKRGKKNLKNPTWLHANSAFWPTRFTVESWSRWIIHIRDETGDENRKSSCYDSLNLRVHHAHAHKFQFCRTPLALHSWPVPVDYVLLGCLLRKNLQ